MTRKAGIDLSEIYKPHPQQVKAHLASEKTVLFGGAIRGGKTVWMVAEGIQLSLDHPGNVGLLCRQDMPSFKRTVLVELERYMDVGTHIRGESGREEFLPLIIQHHQTDHYFKIYTGKNKPASTIWYTGLGDDTRGLASKQGMTLGWFGVDQVEQISEIHFNNLIGRLSLNIPNIKRKVLLTANPMPGWVKERFIVNHPDDMVYIPSLPKDNPYLAEDYESELRDIYPEELVKAWLDGDWNVMESGNFLFSSTELQRAVDRDAIVEGDVKMGVDLSWGGGAESVAIIRQGNKVLSMERWIYRQEDAILNVTQIINLIKRFNIAPKNVNIDAMSGGSPIYSELLKQGYQVNPILAGEKADDALYMNKRAEMYYQLQKRFRDNLISIPNDRKLIAQLASIKYEIASEKKLQLISKEYMRKHGDKSPDRADALALAFYEPITRDPQIRWL